MLFVSMIFSFHLHAKVIHQYFQKIESNNNHIGYAIVREEHLAKKQQIVVTSFVKTNESGGNITEGLKSFSTADKLQPISYQYTAIAGDKSTTIDAVVRKGTLFATITEGKSKKTIQKKLPDNAFFSSVLLPKVLRKGLAVNNNYEFEAVAEEDASVTKGRLQILEKTKTNGEESYKLINDYKQNRFYSYVSPIGKVLKTDNPVTKLSTVTVSSKNEAVGSISYPEVILKTLFGKVP